MTEDEMNKFKNEKKSIQRYEEQIKNDSNL